MSDAPFLGRGWAFPPRFYAAGAEVATVAGRSDVEQSLRVLLTTYLGERVMRSSFGCALDRLLFEELDRSLINQIRSTVSDAILLHEPRVDLDAVEVVPRDDARGLLEISITYAIKATNSRFNMVFPFYLREATPPHP
ncbi:MAG: GPW/gp25 family protein [Nannocystaceae bacterium]